MIFGEIKLKKQRVKKEDVEEALQVCYDNICDSRTCITTLNTNINKIKYCNN